MKILVYHLPCVDNYWYKVTESSGDKIECLYFMTCVGDAICDIKDFCLINNDDKNNGNNDWLYKSKIVTVQSMTNQKNADSVNSFTGMALCGGPPKRGPILE